MDKTKQLEQYINKATNENTSQPEPQNFIEICNIINSRGDMPKIAIALIRKRLMTRNPKVLYLCLELLEVAANACELNFQSQVAAKDFLMILNSLVTREMDKTVLNKLTHLVKYWTQVFAHCKDILPGIFAFYDALEKKGVPMPSTADSKYAYLLKNKPSAAPPKSDHSYGGGYGGGSDHESSRPSGSTGSGSRSNEGGSHKGVSQKLKKDLEVVRQNIQLTNEMIDAQDPREDPKNNDVLTDLVQTLKGMENKLREFISKQNDEATLSFLLELNDDLNKTFERYKAIRRGVKPPPFIPADVQNSIDREDKSGASKPKPQQQQQQQQQQQKPKPSVQDDLLDLLGDTNLNQGQSAQVNNAAMSKAEVQNLFDLDISSPSMPTQQQQGGFNTAQPGSFGGFGGFSGGATPTQPSQSSNTFGQAVQNQPTQPTQPQFNLADLYKTGGQAQPQSQPQGQGQFGGGMGNFATTSGGFNQPQQGFGMNQFQTSQPGFGQAQQGGFNTQSGGMQQGGMQGGFNTQSGGGMQGFGMNQSGMNQGGMGQMGQSYGGMGQMGQGGMGQGMGGMSGYGNFNTGMGQGQGQGGMGQGMGGMGQGMGGFGQAQQNQFGGGSFNTANPNAGFGGNMGGQGGFGGQPQQSNTGFNQQMGGMGGGFNTAPSQPSQNKASNPFDLSDLRDTINQKQTGGNTQPDPFADLL